MQHGDFIPNKTEQIVYNLWNNCKIIKTNNFHIKNILLNVFEQSVYTDYFILLSSVHILNIISIFMRFLMRFFTRQTIPNACKSVYERSISFLS